MIDIHCHILHGFDDGPQTAEGSLDMCRIAAADGITTIVATPHYRPGVYSIDEELLITKRNALQRAVDEKGIEIKILCGADNAVTPELLTTLQKSNYLTLNRTGKYFLAEFAHDTVPQAWNAYLQNCIRCGYMPIITHPERNRWFLRYPDSLIPFVRSGGKIQVTAMSITGDAGKDAYNCCMWLLEREMVHVIASDAHSADNRIPLLSHAVRKAATVLGEEKAKRLVYDVPAAIIQGKPLMAEVPRFRTQRRSRFLRFLGNI